MITEQTTNELIEYLASIQSKFDDLVERSNKLESLIKNLERQGVERGSVYMRGNGYMYLIYPMKDGYRDRKYIGPDKEKQQFIHESIDRARKYDQLASQYRSVNQLLVSSLSSLNECLLLLNNTV
jgi:hypothetical protein